MNLRRIIAACFIVSYANLFGLTCLQTECRATDSTCSLTPLILYVLANPPCILIGGDVAGCGPLSLSGLVTTPYGPAQGATVTGDTDATANAARFNGPFGITTDGESLYVADPTNNKIRRIVIATGAVTTIAGPPPGSTASGDADGVGTAARFNNPSGITTDGTNLYVADFSNNKIRHIVIATGAVTTLAGPLPGSTVLGDADGTGNSARLNTPLGLTTDGTNLYIVDQANHKIRQLAIATGAVTTLAGPAPGSNPSGDTDAIGNASRFFFPTDISTDGSSLFITDSINHKIRKIALATGAVTTLAGPAQGSSPSGDDDGIGTAARLSSPSGITTDGTFLYVTDLANNKIRQIVIATGAVTTLAGPAPGSIASGDADGTRNAARFSSPAGITSDGKSLFVTDQVNNKIRKID